MKIDWPDGVERIPSVGFARQLPQDLPHWSSTVWITEDGQPWRRHLNNATHIVEWKEISPTLRNDTGQLGVLTPAFRSEVNMVAIAWRHRHPDGKGRAHLIDNSNGIHADNVMWKEEEDENSELYGSRVSVEDETWKNLVLEKTGGFIGAGMYLISNRGRLFSKMTRKTTFGFCYKGNRYAGIKGGVLVDLTIASGNSPNEVSLPCHLSIALSAFQRGISPFEHGHGRGIKEGTVFGYYNKIVQYAKDPSIASTFIEEDIWDAVSHLPDDILLGPFQTVRDNVEDSIGKKADTNHLMLSRLCRIRIA